MKSRSLMVSLVAVLVPFCTLFPITNSLVVYTATVTITPEKTTLSLWVDGYDGSVSGKWTIIGTSPYLNAQDQPENYAYSSSSKDVWGNFSFQTTTQTGNIASVTLCIYAETTDNSSSSLSCFVNGDNYSISLPTSWEWTSVNVTATLDTWQKINAAKLQLENTKQKGQTPTISIDAAYLFVQYHP